MYTIRRTNPLLFHPLPISTFAQIYRSFCLPRGQKKNQLKMSGEVNWLLTSPNHFYHSFFIYLHILSRASPPPVTSRFTVLTGDLAPPCHHINQKRNTGYQIFEGENSPHVSSKYSGYKCSLSLYHPLNIAEKTLLIDIRVAYRGGGGGALGFPPSSLSFPPPRIWSESNIEYKKFSGGACHQTP